MIIGLNSIEAIQRQLPFFNVSGSYYYLKLKLSIANDCIFYHNGGLIIKGEKYIPDTLDSVSELSRRLNIPRSSVGRAIQNIELDTGWIVRIGNHTSGVKYKLLITPEKAQEFLEHYTSTLNTKKIKKMAKTWNKQDKWDSLTK